MNRYENPHLPGQAKVRYFDGEFHVEAPGTFVLCAVTGQRIPLDELRYWSVALQEAYVNAETALARYRQMGERA